MKSTTNDLLQNALKYLWESAPPEARDQELRDAIDVIRKKAMITRPVEDRLDRIERSLRGIFLGLPLHSIFHADGSPK